MMIVMWSKADFEICLFDKWSKVDLYVDLIMMVIYDDHSHQMMMIIIIIVNVALQESIKTSGQRQIWEKLRGAPKFSKMFPTKYVLGEVLMSELQKVLFTKKIIINHRNPDFSTFLLSPDKKLHLSLVFSPQQ